jgi:hypothetical protein
MFVADWRADRRDFVTTIWRDVTERVIADAALRDARDALSLWQKSKYSFMSSATCRITVLSNCGATRRQV